MDQSKFNVPEEAPETDFHIRIWPDRWSEPDEDGEESLVKPGTTSLEFTNSQGAINMVLHSDFLGSALRGAVQMAPSLVQNVGLPGVLGSLFGVQPEQGVAVQQPAEPGMPCEGCRYYCIVISREDGEPVAAEARAKVSAYLEVFWHPGASRKLEITRTDLELSLSAELTNQLGTEHFVRFLPESEVLTTLLPLGFAAEPAEPDEA